MEQVIKIFNDIKSTNSKNEKQFIIAQNQNNELFKKCLCFLLDGNVTTGISKAKMKKRIQPTYCADLQTFENVMDYLSSNNTGKDVDVLAVKNFISNQQEEYMDFYYQMVTKTLKLGCDSKTANKAIPNLITTFDVMLGKSIKNVNIPDDAWISISQKLNGSRCVYFKGEFFTRQGKKYVGLEHIKKDINSILGNDVVLDGELLYKNEEKLSDSQAFQIGVGIANSKAEEKLQLSFKVFDMLSVDEFDNKKSTDTYKVRKEKILALGDLIKENKLKHLSIVDIFYSGYDHSQIDKWLDYAEAHDMEGIMINLDKVYECKRSSNLIKVKKFLEYDLEIIGVNEGDGKYVGTLGSIVVDFKGNEVKVGSGFSEEERDLLWRNKEDIIGRIAIVKFKESTNNKKNDLLSLQFPVFNGIAPIGKEVSYE